MGNEFEEVDPAAQRRPEGPLGVVWAVRSDGEAGTRDRAAWEAEQEAREEEAAIRAAQGAAAAERAAAERAAAASAPAAAEDTEE